MGSVLQTRGAIADAYQGTLDAVGQVKCILAALASTGLDKTPTAEHLQRALTELLRAKMQAGAFLDIT